MTAERVGDDEVMPILKWVDCPVSVYRACPCLDFSLQPIQDIRQIERYFLGHVVKGPPSRHSHEQVFPERLICLGGSVELKQQRSRERHVRTTSIQVYFNQLDYLAFWEEGAQRIVAGEDLGGLQIPFELIDWMVREADRKLEASKREIAR